MPLNLTPENDLRLTFVTPIVRTRVPGYDAINAALKRVILAEEALSAGAARSNAGGWHSADTLATWPQDEVQAVRSAVIEACAFLTAVVTKAPLKPGTMDLQAWANINRRGNYNQMHNHPLFHWSAVYYVDLGDPDPDNPLSGLIEFQDPRGPANMAGLKGAPFGSNLQMKPEAGELIVFPSWLYHWVHPFTGGGTRISTAWNIRLPAYWLDTHP